RGAAGVVPKEDVDVQVEAVGVAEQKPPSEPGLLRRLSDFVVKKVERGVIESKSGTPEELRQREADKREVERIETLARNNWNQAMERRAKREADEREADKREAERIEAAARIVGVPRGSNNDDDHDICPVVVGAQAEEKVASPVVRAEKIVSQ
ncbi:unnamed protein product, partial [Laminaria digitata]